MDEIAECSKNETLILDGRAELEDYRDYWFEIFKASLPNTLIFWGTAIAVSLLFAFLFRNSVNVFIFFLLGATILFIIPILISFYSYQSYISIGRRYLRKLSDEEKFFTMTFNLDNDGFECLNGRNYSYISWISIESARETQKHFILIRQIHTFLMSKDIFQNKSQIEFFRVLLSTKLGSKVKFLN